MAGTEGSEISLHLDVPSQVGFIDAVHALAERFAGMAGIDDDAALNVGIAVREAVINAMVHGNGSDPAKAVDLRLLVRGDTLEARIRDSGPGYTPDESRDPTAAENLLATSGRGLLMIRAFMDTVEFVSDSGRGLTLVLTKQLPSTDASTDSQGASTPGKTRRKEP